MAVVTVPGAGTNTYQLQYNSPTSASIATQLLQTIYAANVSGALFPQVYSQQGSTANVPSGKLGELIADGSTGNTNVVAPTGYLGLIDASTTAPVTIAGAAQANESVLGGASDLTFYTNGGSGTVVGGDGNNVIASPTASGGAWTLNLYGVGNTSVYGGAASDLIQSGNGHNLFFLGSGADTVYSSGADTIIAGTGNTTVATSAPGAFVYGGNGTDLLVNAGGADTFSAGGGAETIFAASSGGLYFLNTSPNLEFVATSAVASTIVGGSGNATLFGGSGTNLIFTGQENTVADLQSSNNTIVGGSGNTTVYAGTGHDTLFQGSGQLLYDAQQSNSIIVSQSNSLGGTFFAYNGGQVALFGANNGNVFVAATGNATLQGSGASGNNTYFAGTGADSMVAGSGNDTLVASTGAATMVGGAGIETFIFAKGSAGGTDLIQNFTAHDQLNFYGYGSNAVASQQVVNGSLVITLTDNTKITFLNGTTISAGQIHNL